MPTYLIFSKNGSDLSKYLRAVATELTRVSDLLDSVTNDTIDFYDEVNARITKDLASCNFKNGN